VITAALLLSLAATILLIVQNNDAFIYAGIATTLCAVTLLALPSVLFVFGRRGQPEITRPMRTAVTVSGACIIALGALSMYVMRTGGWPVPGALLFAFGLLAIVRAWRTPVAAGPSGTMAYGGSMAVGVLFVFLAIVAIPKFACGCGSNTRLYPAVMKSDLMNLSTMQEAFFADHGRFASASELGDSLFVPSSGVIVVDIARDTAGWHALVRHQASDQECGIWVGRSPAGGMHDAREGEPKCWPA
jgi:hypothetical protein